MNITELLKPISEEAPCGIGLDELYDDPDYFALESLARGKQERPMGDQTHAAEEPDWNNLYTASLKLLKRAKSIYVAVQLTRALIHKKQIAGLADGLELIAGLVNRYWDSVHPLLDNEDNNNPQERVGALGLLNNMETTVNSIRQCTLASKGRSIQISFRDYLIATDKITLPESHGEQPKSLAEISGVMNECEIDQLQALFTGIERSLAALKSIDECIDEHTNNTAILKFSNITSLLTYVHSFLNECLQRRGIVATADPDDPKNAPAIIQESGNINSREDVIRMLDKACEYFNRQEPSSPVPLLLQRAKRLVSMDFISILQNMAPEGVKQAQNLLGPDK